jgi:hypothetical protein
MQVAFYKAGEGRLCGWTAAPPRRRRFTGTTMASGRDLPHDLAQFVVEQGLGLEHGFWGVLACRGVGRLSLADRSRVNTRRSSAEPRPSSTPTSTPGKLALRRQLAQLWMPCLCGGVRSLLVTNCV